MNFFDKFLDKLNQPLEGAGNWFERAFMPEWLKTGIERTPILGDMQSRGWLGVPFQQLTNEGQQFAQQHQGANNPANYALPAALAAMFALPMIGTGGATAGTIGTGASATGAGAGSGMGFWGVPTVASGGTGMVGGSGLSLGGGSGLGFGATGTGGSTVAGSMAGSPFGAYGIGGFNGGNFGANLGYGSSGSSGFNWQDMIKKILNQQNQGQQGQQQQQTPYSQGGLDPIIAAILRNQIQSQSMPYGQFMGQVGSQMPSVQSLQLPAVQQMFRLRNLGGNYGS